MIAAMGLGLGLGIGLGSGRAVGGGGAPAAPSSLTAEGASSEQVDLAWTDNADDETGFSVERSDDGSSGWAELATPAADATSASVTGLSAGVDHYFRVIATGASANSDPSNVAQARTDLPGNPKSRRSAAAEVALSERAFGEGRRKIPA